MSKEFKSFLIRRTPNVIIYLGNTRVDKKGNLIFLEEDKEEIVIKMYKKILEGKPDFWTLTEKGWEEKLNFLNEIAEYYK